MRSTTPKVLHTLAGRSMLGHTMAAGLGLAPSHLVVVVRHGRDAVAAAAQQVLGDVIIADQDDIPGTGRAVQCAMTALEQVGFGSAPSAGSASVVVIAGDTPLLDDATLTELVAAHHADNNVVTILTTRLDDATGYGRILREPGTGAVTGIVEQRDATPEQLAITEVNTSIYVFDAAVLQTCLGRLGRDNAQGEVYLTDVIALARESGAVRAIECDDPLTVAGVNDRVHLAELRAELNRRLLDDWMRAGVTIVDPATTWVDVTVELAMDVTLLPGTQLHGTTVIGTGATIGPDTTLTDVIVGADASVVRTHGSGAQIGAGATVGPFSFLRPGTVLGGHGKIGAFVEVKNATIGEGSKVPHLSYVGDATIGDHSNIGASSVFANYDGVRKHHTTIGSHARTGSDTIFVAPVTIGDGAYTAAGSVIRRDVPPGALGVSGSSQRNVEGWVLSHRSGTAAAEAGAAALAAAADDASPDETASADTQPKDTAR